MHFTRTLRQTVADRKLNQTDVGMAHLSYDKTLRLSGPIGKTWWASMVFLIAFFSVAEISLRQPLIQRQLPPPATGSENWMFDIKLDLIRRSSLTEPFDCIIIGHSASQGIDPTIMEQAYISAGGSPFGCFHFAIPGLSPYSVARLAQIFVAEYHPRLIIFANNHLGYQLPVDEVGDTPWMQYRSGQFDLEGWLIENSYAYRYYLRWRRSFAPGYDSSPYALAINIHTRLHPLLANGYFEEGANPTTNVRSDADLSKPPDPVSEANLIELYSHYTFLSKQVDALRQLSKLDADQPKLQIVVVEVPVHPSFSLLFPGGETEQQQVRQQLADQITSRGLLYWPLETQPAIPADGWWDRNHVNLVGIEIYSTWLGQRLAQAVQQGELQDPAQ